MKVAPPAKRELAAKARTNLHHCMFLQLSTDSRSDRGQFLAEELRRRRHDDVPHSPAVVLRCSDGNVSLSADVVVAAAAAALAAPAVEPSPSIVLVGHLQAHCDDAHVSLPGFDRAAADAVKDLLYCGRAEGLPTATKLGALGLLRLLGLLEGLVRVEEEEEEGLKRRRGAKRAARVVGSRRGQGGNKAKKSRPSGVAAAPELERTAKAKGFADVDSLFRTPAAPTESALNRLRAGRKRALPTDGKAQVAIAPVPVKPSDAKVASWKENFEEGTFFRACYICGEKCPGLHAFLKHLRLHRSGPGSNETPFSCPNKLCGLEFMTGLSLHQHLVKRHIKAASVKSVCCEEGCEDLVFRSVGELSNHMKNNHATSKSFMCQMCSASYVSKSGLLDHVASKHAEQTVDCEVCGKAFGNRSLLMAHRREQHGGDRTLKCSLCQFVSKGGIRNLRKHVKNRHSQSRSKKFQCSQCSKMFFTKSCVDAHEATHTGQAPFACRLCQANFRRLHHLKVHLRSGAHESRRLQAAEDGQALPEPIAVFDVHGRKGSALSEGDSRLRAQQAVRQRSSHNSLLEVVAAAAAEMEQQDASISASNIQ